MCLIVGTTEMAWAQDPQFSQYYAAAVYHNPGFTGTGTPQRLSVNSRVQWPGLAAPYITSAAAFDFTFPKTGTSFGVLVAQDVTGVSRFRNTNAGLLIAQQLPVSQDVKVNLGTQISYEIRSIGSNSLIFPDQVTKDGILAATAEPERSGQVGLLNVAIGAVAYGQYWWLGLSFHNMNQPSLDPLGGKNATLYTRSTMVGGLKIPLKEIKRIRQGETVDAISPSFMYRNQGSVNQIDLGVMAEVSSLVCGAYLRGLPFLQTAPGVFSQDALILMAGIRFQDLRITYSYDYNTARYLSDFQGAHEIALQIGVNFKKIRLYNTGPCPGM